MDSGPICHVNNFINFTKRLMDKNFIFKTRLFQSGA